MRDEVEIKKTAAIHHRRQYEVFMRIYFIRNFLRGAFIHFGLLEG